MAAAKDLGWFVVTAQHEELSVGRHAKDISEKSNAHHAPVHWKVWLGLGFGAVAGGGSAFEYYADGAIQQALLAALVCIGCVIFMTWLALR